MKSELGKQGADTLTGLSRARTGEMAQATGVSGQILSSAVTQQPAREIQKLRTNPKAMTVLPALGPMANKLFSPAGASEIPAPRANANSGRSPQSIMGQEEPQGPTIEEELVRKPFPRSTEEFLKNKDFVLAKIAQQAPQMFDTIRDVIERNPEQIKDIMPAIVKIMPHLFEHDRYGRYDGKILDPKMRDVARKDIMNDDNISNTQKAIKMQRLNKTGEY